MNKMQEYIIRAGRDLNIRVVAPFKLTVKSGHTVSSEALLPQLGATNGTMIFQSDKEYIHMINEIKENGYTVSVFSEPLPNEEYNIKSYIEMFIDWGWAAEIEKMPAWMKRPTA